MTDRAPRVTAQEVIKALERGGLRPMPDQRCGHKITAFKISNKSRRDHHQGAQNPLELLSNLVYGQPSSGDSVWLLNFLSVHKWSSVDHFCEIGKPT